MKIDRKLKLLGLLMGATLIHSISSAQNTTILGYTNTFDNGGNTAPYQSPDWIYWYSIYQDYYGAVYNLPMTNDPSMDASGNTNVSGSLYVLSPFNNNHDQNAFYGTFAGDGPFDTSVQIQINLITNISFDIHVLPGTVTDANGNFGTIQPLLIAVDVAHNNYDSGGNYLTNSLTIPGAATNGWVHLSETNAAEFAWYANSAGYVYSFGLGFYYNSYGGYPVNPVTFWIDNLTVQTSSAPPPPPPPPTMGIYKAEPGLNLFAGSGTSLYNREDLETVAGNYSWVGAPGPVSYSFTITNYPIPAGDGFQTQIFLIPNPGTESAPDYTESNVVFVDLEASATGAQLNFRYKTNGPDGGSMLYGNGTLASITNVTGVGTWTVTFNQNTNVTMTTPSGTSTNFNISDASGATSAMFASGVVLYYGVQAGNAGGANDHNVTSEFKVTGLPSSFDDNFIADDGVVNTGIWETNAAFPTSIQLVAPGALYWVNWTIPDLGFLLFGTTNLAAGDFNPIPGAANEFGTNVTVLISTANAPGSNSFFTLIRPVFSQLQVLLPGETAAPNTPTGKTGAPTAESAGGFFFVTVNAVDAHWNLVSTVTDTVAITTSDSGANLPPNAALSGGTGQFIVILNDTGAYTVTASDVTDSTKKSNTSSSVADQ